MLSLFQRFVLLQHPWRQDYVLCRTVLFMFRTIDRERQIFSIIRGWDTRFIQNRMRRKKAYQNKFPSKSFLCKRNEKTLPWNMIKLNLPWRKFYLPGTLICCESCLWRNEQLKRAGLSVYSWDSVHAAPFNI